MMKSTSIRRKDIVDGNRILANNFEAWEDKLSLVMIEDRPLEVRKVKNGVVLPVRKRRLTEVQAGGAFDGVFEGGVVTSRFKFVTGVTRHSKKPNSNYSCNFAYRPKGRIKKSHDSVVFGGVVYEHYGHLLTDGLARMWWLTQNMDTPLKTVFVVMPDESTERFEKLLSIAGVSRERYEFITEPVQYRDVLVPEEAVFSLEGRANRAWLSFFDLLVERSEPLSAVDTHSKVYFTRSKWGKGDGINEEYYEEFFAAQGYQVVSPEKFSLEDQIKLYANAEHIACTMGTLSHAALFAKDGTELTCLLRCDTVVMQQLIVNRVRNLDWTMFDAYANPLPTLQGCGAYLYVPTRWFRMYLSQMGIDYPSDEDLRCEMVQKHLGDYLQLWLRTYADPARFRAIFKKDMSDVIESAWIALYDGPIDSDQFVSYMDYKISFLSKQNERRLVRRLKRFYRMLRSLQQ